MAVRNTMDASTSQLTMLHRISSIVNSNLSLDEKLGEVIGLAVQATACDACLVYLIDQSTHEIVLRAWPRLAGWIDDDRTSAPIRQRAESDAAAWINNDRNKCFLQSGARLDGTLAVLANRRRIA